MLGLLSLGVAHYVHNGVQERRDRGALATPVVETTERKTAAVVSPSGRRAQAPGALLKHFGVNQSMREVTTDTGDIDEDNATWLSLCVTDDFHKAVRAALSEIVDHRARHLDHPLDAAHDLLVELLDAVDVAVAAREG